MSFLKITEILFWSMMIILFSDVPYLEVAAWIFLIGTEPLIAPLIILSLLHVPVWIITLAFFAIQLYRVVNDKVTS